MHVERLSADVAVDQHHLVPRILRALVVEGPDEPVPGLDRRIRPSAPVLRHLPLDRRPDVGEPRPGRFQKQGERVGLLVELLLRRVTAALQRHQLVPGVGHRPANVDLRPVDGPGVCAGHVQEELAQRPLRAQPQGPPGGE